MRIILSWPDNMSVKFEDSGITVAEMREHVTSLLDGTDEPIRQSHLTLDDDTRMVIVPLELLRTAIIEISVD